MSVLGIRLDPDGPVRDIHETLAIGTESGPGLIVPVTFAPSQFITMVT